MTASIRYLDDLLHRLPPRDEEAEQCLLGALFLQPDQLSIVQRMGIHAGWFSRPCNAMIYNAMCAVADAHDGKIDSVAVHSHLADHDQLEDVGGGQRLVEIACEVPSGDNATVYAKLVREKHAQAQAVDLAGDLLEGVHNGHFADSVQAMRHELDAIAQQVSPTKPTTTLLTDFVDPAQRPLLVVPTGLGFVDLAMGGGLVPGWMYVFTAPPKTSKSAFAQFNCLALLHTNPSRKVLWCMGEMSLQTLQTRALMMLSGLTSLILERPDDRLTADQLAAKTKGLDEMQKIAGRFHVLPGPFAASEIDAEIERTGTSIVVVDYLQKVQAADPEAQRREQVDAISQRLSQIAVDRNAALIVISNMSGGAATGKPSMATAFKESSGIGFDADAGYLAVLDKETAKLRDNGKQLPDKYPITWRCLGHRHGPENSIRCTFDRYSLRFFGVAREGAG